MTLAFSTLCAFVSPCEEKIPIFMLQCLFKSVYVPSLPWKDRLLSFRLTTFSLDFQSLTVKTLEIPPVATAHVNKSEAVSPAARLMARLVPVKIPGSAAGNVTVKKQRATLAPRPSDASLYVFWLVYLRETLFFPGFVQVFLGSMERNGQSKNKTDRTSQWIEFLTL